MTDIVRTTRKETCAIECRNLASWLVDRANSIEEGLTDDENTMAILERYVGRIKARIDWAGWAKEHVSQVNQKAHSK
mgnify:CR=1 FL=1|tara:strand:- start:2558 stop:2788 length:231 start_codon:yes stop_codon:yes gene_type:complete